MFCCDFLSNLAADDILEPKFYLVTKQPSISPCMLTDTTLDFCAATFCVQWLDMPTCDALKFSFFCPLTTQKLFGTPTSPRSKHCAGLTHLVLLQVLLMPISEECPNNVIFQQDAAPSHHLESFHGNELAQVVHHFAALVPLSFSSVSLYRMLFTFHQCPQFFAETCWEKAGYCA